MDGTLGSVVLQQPVSGLVGPVESVWMGRRPDAATALAIAGYWDSTGDCDNTTGDGTLLRNPLIDASGAEPILRVGVLDRVFDQHGDRGVVACDSRACCSKQTPASPVALTERPSTGDRPISVLATADSGAFSPTPSFRPVKSGSRHLTFWHIVGRPGRDHMRGKLPYRANGCRGGSHHFSARERYRGRIGSACGRDAAPVITIAVSQTTRYAVEDEAAYNSIDNGGFGGVRREIRRGRQDRGEILGRRDGRLR